MSKVLSPYLDRSGALGTIPKNTGRNCWCRDFMAVNCWFSCSYIFLFYI